MYAALSAGRVPQLFRNAPRKPEIGYCLGVHYAKEDLLVAAPLEPLLPGPGICAVRAAPRAARGSFGCAADRTESDPLLRNSHSDPDE
jgi:hypothetical protein